MFDDKLHMLEHFGKLKELGEENVQVILEWMLKENLLLKTRENVPVIHSTYEGLHYSEIITKSKILELKKYLEQEVVLWR
ncbi:hypothetical protein CIY_23480 [Butyrivibrio fibrisolvens 16/4]|nr:hypothetical protein CIY_23480 [Butyrivibrio fibrisolvens 16/4]